jgi:lysophospholipase L1-like esterase
METASLTSRTLPRIGLLFLLNIAFGSSSAHAQGSAFSYQGWLNDGNSPATGIYDVAFTLFSTATNGSAVAGPVTNTATAVSNGLFTVSVDFGTGVFTGGSNWLEIAVATNGSGNFITLIPRQPVNAVPYALYANTASNLTGNVSATNITGVLPIAQLPPTLITNGASGLSISGIFTGDGSSLTNVVVNPQSIANNPGIVSIVPVVNSAPMPATNWIFYALDPVSTNFTCTGGILQPNPTYPTSTITIRQQTGLKGPNTVDRPSWSLGFGIDGNVFCLNSWDYGQFPIISVDGYDNDTTYTFGNGDGQTYLYVTLTTAGHHWITIKNANNVIGVYIPITNGWFAVPPVNITSKLAIMGDSYIEHVPTNTWADFLGNYLPGVDICKLGEGGTGWSNANAASSFTNFWGRLGDITNLAPNYCIFAGGINDGGYGGSDPVGFSNIVFVTALDAKLLNPATKFAVVGPFWPRTPSGSDLTNVVVTRLIISNACVNAGLITPGQFIDPLGNPLLITGNVLVPNSGTADQYISPLDQTHPTTAGHRAIAQFVSAHLAQIWPELYGRAGSSSTSPGNIQTGTTNVAGATSFTATFSGAFPDTNYTAVATGNGFALANWYVSNKTTTNCSFNMAPANGNIDWMAVHP